MDSDLTFITNEKNRNLLERFRVLIRDTQFFDVLVGYFLQADSTLFINLWKNKENQNPDWHWYE